jgi:hypothetical protein
VDVVEKETDPVVFWTCDEEKSPVVFQIGTSDAVQAVQTANLVYVCYSYLLPICREHQGLCCCISFFPTSGLLLVTMTNQGRWLSIECCFDIRSGDIRSHSPPVSK